MAPSTDTHGGLDNGCQAVPESKERDVLKPLQAAHMLGINRYTLERMARDRYVPAIKIGRLWRFRQSDLEAWIDSKVSVRNVNAVR